MSLREWDAGHPGKRIAVRQRFGTDSITATSGMRWPYSDSDGHIRRIAPAAEGPKPGKAEGRADQ